MGISAATWLFACASRSASRMRGRSRTGGTGFPSRGTAQSYPPRACATPRRCARRGARANVAARSQSSVLFAVVVAFALFGKSVSDDASLANKHFASRSGGAREQQRPRGDVFPPPAPTSTFFCSGGVDDAVHDPEHGHVGRRCRSRAAPRTRSCGASGPRPAEATCRCPACGKPRTKAKAPSSRIERVPRGERVGTGVVRVGDRGVVSVGGDDRRDRLATAVECARVAESGGDGREGDERRERQHRLGGRNETRSMDEAAGAFFQLGFARRRATRDTPRHSPAPSRAAPQVPPEDAARAPPMPPGRDWGFSESREPREESLERSRSEKLRETRSPRDPSTSRTT